MKVSALKEQTLNYVYDIWISVLKTNACDVRHPLRYSLPRCLAVMSLVNTKQIALHIKPLTVAQRRIGCACR